MGECFPEFLDSLTPIGVESAPETGSGLGGKGAALPKMGAADTVRQNLE